MDSDAVEIRGGTRAPSACGSNDGQPEAPSKGVGPDALAWRFGLAGSWLTLSGRSKVTPPP